MKNESSITIDVIVVEPHHHALEHIHSFVRRKARKSRCKTMSSWTMIHFDSHPDLACPNHDIPARLCFTPRMTTKRRSSTPQDALGAEVDTDRQREMKIDQGTRIHDANSSTESDHIEEKNLYELLDTSMSGIAEWIIPLVFAAGLCHVHWIKNDWCDQFHNGIYCIHIGAWIPPTAAATTTATTDDTSQHDDDINNDDLRIPIINSYLDLPENASVKTSFCHQYYIDDNCVVPHDELNLKQQFQLHVSTALKAENCLNHRKHNVKSSKIQRKVISVEEEGEKESGWILDICLDYFICSNPFRADIEKIDNNIANNLNQVVIQLLFKKMIQEKEDELNIEEACMYQSISNKFMKLVRIYFRNFLAALIDHLESSTSSACAYSDIMADVESNELYCLYETPLIGEKIWDDLTVSLHQWSIGKSQNEIQSLCDIILEALPNLTLPHSVHINNTSNDDDDNINLSSEVIAKVQTFGKELKLFIKDISDHEITCTSATRMHLKNKPDLITIARSSDDGFTPVTIVEKLQKAVLEEIHNVFCDFSCHKEAFYNNKMQALNITSYSSDDDIRSPVRENCTINIVLDYGEYEGASLD